MAKLTFKGMNSKGTACKEFSAYWHTQSHPEIFQAQYQLPPVIIIQIYHSFYLKTTIKLVLKVILLIQTHLKKGFFNKTRH